MTHPPRYQTDSYARELDVLVTDAWQMNGRPYARTDDSVIYPGGGGQPADHGSLAGIPLTDVLLDGDGYVFGLGAAVAEGPARLALDWNRRFDHMQQHTAQHLLTAVADDAFGWATTSFHLGRVVCDIELDVDSLPPAALEELEGAVMERVRAALPVCTTRVSVARYGEMEVRSRGLPPNHTGDVRLVEIQGVDLAACGGTHLRNTSEIESLALLTTESVRGGTRLHWVAGARLRRHVARSEARTRQLRGVLGVSDDELVDAATARSEQLKAARKAYRRLEQRLATVWAEHAASRSDPTVHVDLGDASPEAARSTAGAFMDLAGDGIGVFTCTGPKGPFVVVAAGPQFSGDVPSLGGALVRELGGTGGGNARLFQGRAASFDRLPGALLNLERRVGGAPFGNAK